MNCDQIHEITPLYLTGELQGEPLKEFNQHIAECRACAGNVDSDRQLDSALRSAFEEEVLNPSAVVARVRKQINGDVRTRRVPWRVPHLAWAKAGFAFAAALVLAIATLGSLSGYWHQKDMALAAADDHFNDLVLHRHSDWLVKPAVMAAFLDQQFPQHAGLLARITLEHSSLEKVRLCRLKQATYAHLVFKTGEVETSVFLIDNPRRSPDYQAAHLRNVGHDLEVSGFSASDLSGIVVGPRGMVPTNQIARQLAERLSL